jgi:hypothetical protein
MSASNQERVDQNMKPETSKAGTLITCADQGDRSDVWFIILQGLTPLALLAVIGVAVLVLIMLIRFLIDPTRFLVEELIFAIVMIAGLALAIISYVLTVRRALRHIETWRQSGQTTKVMAGLVALALVALITALPVILALFFSLV